MSWEALCVLDVWISQNSSKGHFPTSKLVPGNSVGGFSSDSEPTGGSQVIFPGLVHPGCAPNLALSLFIFFPSHSLMLLSAACMSGAGLGGPLRNGDSGTEPSGAGPEPTDASVKSIF